MKVKEENEKSGLKQHSENEDHDILSHHFMANRWGYSFPYLEPVCCSMSSSYCCLLTCIQISQEADKVVWYSHLFQNFPQFVVIHIVKSFGIVNKAKVDVFMELSCFFWRRQWHPTPVFLPGKSHGPRSLVGYRPRGCRVQHD